MQEETWEENKEEEEHIQDIELEAKYVAERIKKLIESNYQVYDVKKQEFRNIKYKDIAILSRYKSYFSKRRCRKRNCKKIDR